MDSLKTSEAEISLLGLLTVCLLCLFFLSPPCRCQAVGDYIDFNGLTNSGDDWEVIYQRIQEKDGHIKLHQDKWLMYFLHWRPLTEEKKDLSLEYVRDHMKNFWGEAFNFELNNIEGGIEIAGHKGFFTEGSFYEGAIYTRFIVWNCPETNRQFTADCNINLRRGTPRELLELQKSITKTVCCHRGASGHLSAQLPQKYESDRWNISFYIPSNWRTAEFVPREWFPDGMSEQNGSLWALLTDSQKHLELLWQATDGELSSSLFNQFLNRLPADSSFPHGSAKIVDLQLNSLQREDNYYAGEGIYKYRLSRGDKPQVSNYGFKAILWRNQGKVYFLLASLIELQEFWGINNDLALSAETWNRYLREEIIPNVRVFEKTY